MLNVKVLLGVLYGKGIPAMARDMNLTVEAATDLYNKMMANMPELLPYLESQKRYITEHNGLANSLFGNIIDFSNESKDRWGRLGVNGPIQGGSSILMGTGFDNVVFKYYESKETEHQINGMIWNIIHDSSQHYLDVNNIFDCDKFYHREMQEYIYNLAGISYDFDLEIFCNFKDDAILASLDDKTIKISGGFAAINGILRKIYLESNLEVRIKEAKMKVGDDFENILLPNGKFDRSKFKSTDDNTNSFRFVNMGLEACWPGDNDSSHFEVIIEKIGEKNMK